MDKQKVKEAISIYVMDFLTSVYGDSAQSLEAKLQEYENDNLDNLIAEIETKPEPEQE